MNSNTSNPDEAKEATDKSTKKNIPGLALLLLDLAVLTVALASSYHWMQSEIVHETRLIGDHALAARFSLTVNDIV